MDSVHVDHDGQVLVITLNRPQVRNAMDAAMARAVAEGIDRLDADPGLTVGILTGAGGNFSSGMDLKAFSATGERPQVPGRGLTGFSEKPPRKPLIAAVEGYALAGGCEIVLACDLVTAALELAAEISANGPLAVQTSKQVVMESPSWPADEIWPRQHDLLAEVLASSDAREGARAFVEKRPPNWRGE